MITISKRQLMEFKRVLKRTITNVRPEMTHLVLKSGLGVVATDGKVLAIVKGEVPKEYDDVDIDIRDNLKYDSIKIEEKEGVLTAIYFGKKDFSTSEVLSPDNKIEFPDVNRIIPEGKTGLALTHNAIILNTEYLPKCKDLKIVLSTKDTSPDLEFIDNPILCNSKELDMDFVIMPMRRQ